MDIQFIAIVKNEAKVIQECINSVANLIDSYLICDTGSDDGTPEIIEKHMANLNIPGRVIHKEWRNFGWNRNYLHSVARNEPARFHLWIDADEKLISHKTRTFPSLDEKFELLNLINCNPEVGIFTFNTIGKAKDETIIYPRVHMSRNNQLFNWRSPVHEHIHPTEPTTQMHLDSFFVSIKCSQGIKPRLYNDIKVLHKFIKDFPDSYREVFYLAQTYRDTHQFRKAIKYYEKRVQMSREHIGERYISYLWIGRLYYNKKRVEKALENFQKAHDEHPRRVEAIYELISILYEQKRKEEAWEKIQTYELPDELMVDMFIEAEIWEWKYNWLVACVAMDLYPKDKSIIPILRRSLKDDFLPSHFKSLLRDKINKLL